MIGESTRLLHPSLPGATPDSITLMRRGMLDTLVTSKTRIKILLKFFLNHTTEAYLRGLSEEFGESTNAVRVELNRLTEAGFLQVRDDGRTKLYQANKNHALFPELHSLVKKYTGIDQVIDSIIAKLGKVDLAFISGDYAKGIDSGIIDLTIVGDINTTYLYELIDKTEKMIKRKIKVLILTHSEYIELREKLTFEHSLLVWSEKKG